MLNFTRKLNFESNFELVLLILLATGTALQKKKQPFHKSYLRFRYQDKAYCCKLTILFSFGWTLFMQKPLSFLDNWGWEWKLFLTLWNRWPKYSIKGPISFVILLGFSRWSTKTRRYCIFVVVWCRRAQSKQPPRRRRGWHCETWERWVSCEVFVILRTSGKHYIEVRYGASSKCSLSIKRRRHGCFVSNDSDFAVPFWQSFISAATDRFKWEPCVFMCQW